ncbi:MAG: glycosyltransferase [Deltaproteobacteria bacterium]|nr:glycosyltransferase [Deltaproteobacteria bacterium]MBW2068303.1 glycosyltransferase [Deltaproteobacteria bacterium]
MDKEPKLSVCMIVKNEASNLEELLPQVTQFADEIVIVDTGSNDETPEVARRFTSKVYSFAWNDNFSDARNYGLEKATGDYFLWLDADDRVPDRSITAIRELKSHFDGKKFFYFLLKDIRPSDSGSGMKVFSCFYQIRCAPLKPDVRFYGAVHELLNNALSKPAYQPVQTDVEIEHYGYKNETVIREKLKRNLKLLLAEKDSRKDDLNHQVYLSSTLADLGRVDEAKQILVDYLNRCFFELCEKGKKFELFYIYTHLVRYELEKKQFDDAKRWLVKAEAYSEDDVFSLCRLAVFWEKLGCHQKAIEFLYRMFRAPFYFRTVPTPEPPKLEDIHLCLCFNFLCLGEEKNFEFHFNKALECGGKSRSECYEWLASRAILSNRFDVMKRVIDIALDEGCESPVLHRYLGVFYKATGFRKEAENQFLRSLELDPSSVPGRIYLAWIFLEKGQVRESWALWNQLFSEGERCLDVLLGCMVCGLLLRYDIESYEKLLMDTFDEDGGDGNIFDKIHARLIRDGRKELLVYFSFLKRNLLKMRRSRAD